MAITFKPSSDKQKYLVGSPPNIDVIKDCAWAIFDGNSIAAKEVPYARLIEWQPIGDQFATRAKKFIAQKDGISEGMDSYKDTYSAKKTGNTYTFPYFTQEMRSKSNNWTEDRSIADIATGARGVIANAGGKARSSQSIIAKIAGGVMGIGNAIAERGINYATGSTLGVEWPKIWQGTNTGATYTFDFFLHNTVSEEQTASNWALTYMLSYNNSYNRRSLILQDAPVVYQVFVPGVRYSPISSMKDLKINMIGQMRNMSNMKSFGLPSSVIIPESYHVIITMEDLFVESRQMMELVTQGSAATNVTVFAPQ